MNDLAADTLASDRRRAYLPDVDERCLNCGRGYAGHDHYGRCYPAGAELDSGGITDGRGLGVEISTITSPVISGQLELEL